MSRLTSIKRLAIAALSAAGVVAACRGIPGEAPPLAPRPDIGKPSDPVPGAPDPIAPQDPATPGPRIPPTDAGPISIPPTPPGPITIDPPSFRSSAESMQVRPDAAPDAAPDAGPDSGVPDASDAGVGLPPVPDAALPGAPLRPLR